MPIDYKELEGRWRAAWKDAHVYEPEPDDREAVFVSAAFPYVNTPQHIGHLRTYGTTDIYARYMRLKGKNVLFPMGFHATGTPILAVAKRIANNDADLIGTLSDFDIPIEDIRKMADPLFCANYIMGMHEEGFTLSGLSIDWRRRLISIEPIFSRMVEWQFGKLNEAGMLKKGLHPVGWCPNENNAVGQHDTKGDTEPEIEEITAVKFKDTGSDASFACATYRPETIDGVTNIFVGENIEYVIAEVDGSKCYMSRKAAEMLTFQKEVKIKGVMSAGDLLKKRAVNPSNGEEIPVLPGYFVKAGVGTGMVMSVPAHAPFDYVALDRLRRAGYALPEMKYRKVVIVKKDGAKETEDGEIPALAHLDMASAGKGVSDETVELATKSLYRVESRWGVMAAGKYIGRGESEARDLIKSDLVKAGNAFAMHELSNSEPVKCRCGTEVVVKLVDQWFIDYGDAGWKEKVRSHMKDMVFIPDGLRHAFGKVLDWIELRATERAQGLGTRFPLSPDHIIEPLSDSTVYMSLYTYINILREAKVADSQLKPEFFEYVYMSKGDPDSVSLSTGIDKMVVKRCGEEFDYWYRNTSRHSGSDLIYSHLTMYMFMHLLLFERERWPSQIVVNGLVNYEGQKMSKSLGNIIPLKRGIGKYGADPLRFVETATADLGTETEFSEVGIRSIQSKNESMLTAILALPDMKSNELTHIDYWLYSRLNSKIRVATAHMDSMSLKEAYLEIYYNSINELKRYGEHGGSNGMVVRDYLEKITIMLSPVMPHVAEEFWHLLGKTTFVVKERWPDSDESMVNETEEHVAEIVDATVQDIRGAIEMTSKIGPNKDRKAASVEIIIANPWKTVAMNALAKEKSISKVMELKELAEVDRQKLSKFLSAFAKKINALVPVPEVSEDALASGFTDSLHYMEAKTGVRSIVVSKENESKSPRAERAQPGRPGIDIAWE